MKSLGFYLSHWLVTGKRRGCRWQNPRQRFWYFLPPPVFRIYKRFRLFTTTIWLHFV